MNRQVLDPDKARVIRLQADLVREEGFFLRPNGPRPGRSITDSSWLRAEASRRNRASNAARRTGQSHGPGSASVCRTSVSAGMGSVRRPCPVP